MTENPKRSAGLKKIPLAEMPQAVIAETNIVFLGGGFKYDTFNYRVSDIVASDYLSAHRRHMTLWEEFGQELDPEDSISHLTHAIACLTVLRDAQMSGRLVDDRPPPLDISIWNQMELKAAAVRAKFGRPAPDRCTKSGVRRVDIPATKPEDGVTGQLTAEDASARGVDR